eukprot:gene13553-14953_t
MKVSINQNESENERTANTFASYFGNVVKDLKLKFTTMIDYVWRKIPVCKKTNEIFRFSYVSKMFVEKQLKALKRNKSTGLDELPPGMIKDCAEQISKPLAYIINLSIISGEIPSIWKKAKIIPIHKNGDKKPENYRPISILPIFSKIIERAVHRQLLDFLEANKLLTNEQFGYRHQRSTKLASTFLFDDIRKSIDNGHMVGADLKSVAEYFDSNELIINLKRGKTEAMIFGTAKRLQTTNKELDYLTKDKNKQHAAYRIYTMMIVPLLTYRGPVKLAYTKTQESRFSSLERRAKQIIGRSVPSILNSIKKEALLIVKRALENEVCTNFEDYFQIREHQMVTRNKGHLLVLPKSSLNLKASNALLRTSNGNNTDINENSDTTTKSKSMRITTTFILLNDDNEDTHVLQIFNENRVTAAATDYEVWFGDANSLPSCTCYDWTSSPYLCKHFLAVFKKYPLWSWEALSPQYRESPFFKLDEEFSIKNTNTNLASEDDNGELPIESMTNDIQEEVVNEQKNHTSNDEANDLKQSPTEADAKERLPPKNIASMCREVTNEIRNASFLLESEQNVLMEAYDMLKKMRDKLLQACPKEKGLPLLNEANMVKNKTTSANLKLQLLPPRKRKGPLTNRIGEKKERYDIAKKIKVVVEQEPEPDIQEEFVAMNDEICEGENLQCY